MHQQQQRTVDVDKVLEEIEVQIDVLDTLGGQYARDYFAHALGLTPQPPHKPRRMHHLIAKALRDMASDEATAVQLYEPRRLATFRPGQRGRGPAGVEHAA